MKNKICIGTAQFGMRYGVTNKTGTTGKEEIKKVFEVCQKEGIRYIDTAMNYGSSEENLGECIEKKNKFKIITKISTKDVCDLNKFSAIKAEKALNKSIERLKVRELEGLLIHSPEILCTRIGDELLEWMSEKKIQGKVRNIGVSIYELEDLSRTKLEYIDIVQVPLSLFDQRIYENGGIDYLYDKGIKIFARSIFLQGILLAKDLSEYILSPEIKNHHKLWVEFLRAKNVSQLQECINYISSIKKLEALTIGVENKRQLSQIIQAIENPVKDYSTNDYMEWNWSNIDDIDPRKWQKNKEKSF